MNSIITGMFWAGMLMALPPVALGVGLIVFIRRQQRAERAANSESSGD